MPEDITLHNLRTKMYIHFRQKQFNNDCYTFMYPLEDDLTIPKHVVVCITKEDVDRLISVIFIDFCVDGHASTSRESRNF
jgi:hypothetical protein